MNNTPGPGKNDISVTKRRRESRQIRAQSSELEVRHEEPATVQHSSFFTSEISASDVEEEGPADGHPTGRTQRRAKSEFDASKLANVKGP